ncbi:MAG: DUF6624 domain-containing protein [Bacteroidota bacterium]
MRSLLCLGLLSFISFTVSAQTFSSQNPAYIEGVQAGEQALRAESYSDCLRHYEAAFKIKQTSFLSTLRAAACAHSAGKNKLRDYYLDHAFTLSPDGSRSVFLNYDEFRYLDNSAFAELIESRFRAAFPDYDVELAAKLAEVGQLDQAQRRYMGEVSEKYGWESPQMDSLWAIQNHSDSVNTLYITGLIDKMGYPGKSIVGDEASTAFLVIQHASLEVQEKYLPILKAAAEEGELNWSSLALLIDRVEMRNDRPQIYGSQVQRDPETGEHYFARIKDPHNIDEIRAEVGLGPIQGYANNWNFTFDPDKHIERHEAKKDE